LVLRQNAKTPRLTGNRGVFENPFLESEVRSHDAMTAANACPNGHLSFGLRVLQHGCKRGFHFLHFLTEAAINTISRRLSNGFVRRKIVVGFAFGAKLNLR